MFSNFAWSEILVIACVAIIVVGPKDLPAMLRSLGKTIGGVKRMAGDFQKQFNDALKEADLDEVKNLTSTKGYGPLEDARKSMEELTRSVNEPVKNDPAKDELEAEAVVPSATTDTKTTKGVKAQEKTTPPSKSPAKTTASKPKTASAKAKAASAKATTVKPAAVKSSTAATKGKSAAGSGAKPASTKAETTSKASARKSSTKAKTAS